MLDIDGAIASIRQKIATLEERLDILERAKLVAIEEIGSNSATTDPAPRSVHPKKSNRRDQLVAFISEHGPMKRSELIMKAGLPKGTVSGLLLDKGVFKNLGHGMWGLQGPNQEDS